MTSIYRILLSFTILLFSSESFADAAEIEQLENRIKVLQQQISANSASISSYQEKYTKASGELESAKVNLAETEIAFNVATSNETNDPSPENARTLRRVSDIKKLAERKVSSRQKRVDWLSNEMQSLESDSASARQEINQSNTRIAAVKASWQEKIKRDEANAAKVAEQKRQAAAKKVAAAKAKPSPKPMPVMAKLPTQNKSDAKVPAAPADNDKAKISEYKAYVAEGVDPSPSINLRIGFSDKSGRIRFEHLGGEIYRGEASLKKGRQVVNYDGSSFRIEVAKADHKKPHLIYFDNRDKGNREIVVVTK